MISKSNQILMGLILILLGVLTFTQRYIIINYAYLAVFFAGCAFLLLYKTKRKSFSLIIGSYLMFFGLMGILFSLGFPKQFLIMVLNGTFFIIPGIVFFVLFYTKNKLGLLYPASMFIWIGIYVIIMLIPTPNTGKDSIGLLLFCIGMAFMTIHVFLRKFYAKKYLYQAIVLIILGIAKSFSLVSYFISFKFFISCSIIAIGIFIILKALKKH